MNRKRGTMLFIFQRGQCNCDTKTRQEQAQK
jgi:hypothetical protein